MVFQPGDPKPPSSGRRKGTPNKRNAAINDKVTEIVLARLDHLGRHLDRMQETGNNSGASALLLKLVQMSMPRGITLDHAADQTDAEDQP